ncbi:uncharacterized protein LOC116296429 [Actinia tenebrosa]|uniref:Uncharacterized protein LOC116296429 n=1 Tax=Actinia tenebrosa TaxID=6105 RepID=A0A6P8HY88_ACTTE|nr:uncharacterized protein LOC116296429 [Actinia tenebrosa]
MEGQERNLRNVFVTGCNRGIGLEFVKQFLHLPKPPQNIFATCRALQHEESQELRNLTQEHPNLHLLQLDVTNEEDIAKVAAEVGKVLGEEGLNLVINNAGLYLAEDLKDVTADHMMQAFQTNTVGPLMIIKALLPFLKPRAALEDPTSGVPNKAVIVNLSSRTASVADNTSGKMYPSRASKAALNIITKSLSVDLKPDGITAIVINPGWVKTRAGGANALITTQESVSGMMRVISSLDQSKTGMFFDYKGEIVPW